MDHVSFTRGTRGRNGKLVGREAHEDNVSGSRGTESRKIKKPSGYIFGTVQINCRSGVSFQVCQVHRKKVELKGRDVC